MILPIAWKLLSSGHFIWNFTLDWAHVIRILLLTHRGRPEFRDPFLWLWLCLVSSSHPYLKEILVRHASVSTWKSEIAKIRANFRTRYQLHSWVIFIWKDVKERSWPDKDLRKISCENSHFDEHNERKKFGLNSISFKKRLYLMLV